MKPYEDISLVVCSRNRHELLLDTLRSILKGSLVPRDIVVIDQSDKANELLMCAGGEFAEVRYVRKSSRGLSRALNLGIVEAQHDLLVFTHDDVLVTNAWLATLVTSLLAAGERCVVTGRVLSASAEIKGAAAPSVMQCTTAAFYEGSIDADVLYPMNMALFRSAFEEVGLFDTRLGPGTDFPASEDNDFGFRLLKAGYRIHYVPEAVVYHRAWRRNYFRLRWSYGVGQGAFYAKYLRLRDRHILWRFAKDVARRLGRLPQMFIQNPRRALGNLTFVAGLFTGATRWLIRTDKRQGGHESAPINTGDHQ